MKGTAMGLVALLLLTGLSGCFGEEPREEVPLEEIRLNDLRMKGTHNSYHVKTPGVSTITPENNYTHANLDVQADRLGVRQFELDVHYIPPGWDCVSTIQHWIPRRIVWDSQVA